MTPETTRAPGVDLTVEEWRRLDTPGPRYTSYPTADRFVEAFGPGQYQQALQQRRAMGGAGPLSVYVHIPFCESVCYYCACNKIVTKQHKRGAEYLQLLGQEMDLQVKALGSRQALAQLHLGGGSPTFLDDDELAALMARLRDAFDFQPQAEISIEVDPRTANAQRLAAWRAMGFNRLSFGVQDIDPQVQQAVHRVQPWPMVCDLVGSARDLGFQSINVDLIYGLPQQTPETFSHTVKQVGELRPSRIALYGYAHLPQRFKPQRRIHAAELPDAPTRVQMLKQAVDGFTALGYVYIGMDHFALPDDSLAVARRQGRLHRNFQGYSTQPDHDILGLGVSAIGRVGATYNQNAKTLQEYQDALSAGALPVVRGLRLTREDVLRRAVIMSLMCQGRVDFEAIDAAHLVSMRSHFATEFERLKPLQAMGLVALGDDHIQLTAKGWYFVRSVAMVFDQYLSADQVREQFSRVL